MQQWRQPFSMLKAQMIVKANQKGAYVTFKIEIENLMKEQDDFLNEIYMFIGTSEALDQDQDTLYICVCFYACIYIYISIYA